MINVAGDKAPILTPIIALLAASPEPPAKAAFKVYVPEVFIVTLLE